MSEKEAIAKLAELGVEESTAEKLTTDLGVESVEDLGLLEVADLTSAGIKLIQARKIYAELHPEEPKEAAPAANPMATQMQQQEARMAAFAQMEALLPSVPSDESWLTSLKIGGIKKIDDSSNISAIRAALANRAGLYSVNKKLVELMEKFADETDEQVDPEFFAIRKQLTRKNYAEVFEAIDGLDASFVSPKRTDKFLATIEQDLWPAIIGTYRALNTWEESRRATMTDPSMLFAAFTGAGVVMPAPDTAPLHDAGDALIDATNHVFRGTGLQISAALAVDAQNIRKTLENPRLPAMIGVPNREMMLKKLGLSINANYVRLEQNLVKYVLSFLRHDLVTSDTDVNYFIALWQLGSQINWGELGVTSAGSAHGGTAQRGRPGLTSITGSEI